MSESFEELRIVDLDVEKTRPSPKASGLRHMFLRLSGFPPAVWVQLFNNERAYPRHTMWRHVWVEREYIVVDCAHEEIELHLADLKEDVANSNAKYRQYMARVKAENEKKAEEKQREHDELQNLKKKLNFDS